MKTFLSPLLLALAVLPTTATAQDRHVRYTDLDLASPAGIATLEQRIEAAIDDICRPGDSIELGRKVVVERCRRVLRTSVAVSRDQVLARAAASSNVALSALPLKPERPPTALRHRQAGLIE